MDTHENDKQMSHFAMTNANMTMIRGVMQHLVEEGLMEGSKAAQIVRDAAQANMPAEKSSGPLYDLGRDYLLALARAFRGFPSYPESGDAPRALRRDRW